MKYQKIVFLVCLLGIVAYKNNSQAEPMCTNLLGDHAAATALGWTPAPVTRNNLCGGYYQDPYAALIQQTLPSFQTSTINVEADQGSFKQTGTSVLMGSVTITQPGRAVHADKVYLNRDPKTGKVSTVDLVGNVTLQEPGRTVKGDSGHMELGTKIGHMIDTIYRFLVSALIPSINTNAQNIANLNAWGRASLVDRQSTDITVLQDATYSTCSPLNTVWQVHAQHITLNHDTGRGTAINTWVDILDVPVFYTPYFNFPIDNRRQTGFLYPAISYSNRSGTSVTLPFYWNIAPNYDATITPDYFSSRGLQMNGLFRYLTDTSAGVINGSILPNDRAFTDFKHTTGQQFFTSWLANATSLPALKSFQVPQSQLVAEQPGVDSLLNDSSDRRYFSYQDTTKFDSRWNAKINYNYVSDDYYYQDFGVPVTTTANQLPREGTLNYLGDHWNFSGSLQGYQTLHPINMAEVVNQYQRLPELNFNGDYPDSFGGLDFKMNNQYVYFLRQANPGEIIPNPPPLITDPSVQFYQQLFFPSTVFHPNTSPPTGNRLNIEPGVSLPIVGLSGYITPQIQLDATHYVVGNQVNGFNSDIQRTLPIIDVDSGLYFDRDFSLGAKGYQQTLEPRLFYLFVPYRNQNDIPLYDTALVPFNYDYLFLTNRFSGLDRIGDANQVSLGITSRILDQDSGDEKARASVGEIFYFRNRVVTTCTPPYSPGSAATDTSCVNPMTVLGYTSTTENRSPYAAELNYHLNKNWSIIGNAAWDPFTKQTINSSAVLHFQPATNPSKIFNITYNFVRLGDTMVSNPPPPPLSNKNNLNQYGFSFAWPLSDRWSTVGGWNYNLSHTYPQSFFYGLEYDNCCWAARLVAGKAFVSSNPNGTPNFNNAIYLQWQFKGLGNLGTQDPTMYLMNNIPGYANKFQAL